MTKSITIAIPNSALINYYNIRDKTERIGAIARTCAIFRVTEIIIYNDTTLGSKKSEFEGGNNAFRLDSKYIEDCTRLSPNRFQKLCETWFGPQSTKKYE